LATDSGTLVIESLRDYSKRTLTRQFASLDVFLKRWNEDTRKQAIIDELAAEGLLLDPLADEVGKDLDPFDLICYVAFDQLSYWNPWGNIDSPPRARHRPAADCGGGPAALS